LVLQFRVMDRLPFGTRARKRIAQDTLASFKKRMVPFGIGIVGLVLGFLINLLYLHKQTAKEILFLGLGSFGGSYIIFFLGSFLVNTLRVSWLLDAESGEQINAWEARAFATEKTTSDAEAIAEEKRRLQDLFGGFLNEGESLANQLRRGMADYGTWLDERQRWATRVSQSLIDMHLPTRPPRFAMREKKTFQFLLPVPLSLLDFIMTTTAASWTDIVRHCKKSYEGSPKQRRHYPGHCFLDFASLAAG